MRKLFLMAAVLMLGIGCSKTENNDPWGKIDPETTPARSKTLDGSMQSTAMHRSMTYSVWLPAGYDEEKTYPFLYLLHGYEDNNQDAKHNRCWLDKGNAAYLADDYQKGGGVAMVIVMPNGLDKFYMSDGYEQYFEEEFLPEMEKRYHGNGKRAIAGLSMGGFGTLYHALKYPQKFTCAYAMSPAADASMAGYVDDKLDKSVYPSFTFEVGTDDRTVDNGKTKALYNSLKGKGLECEWVEWTVNNVYMGDHVWEFWQGCFPKALQKVGASFK